ncbi:NAD-dependent epimerase/dehydratase family protein [Facklamia hominis]|uniref:NAD-dependent epimerase/dehydratase family protein n=1 Tax=Facklamia hominis TaxID=178214 RepID=UPI000C79A134|nr:NAD-dependent epimerase/dehydratase family protein [Facklamia hominis]PKY93788.1 NAD-dependent epimerase [Facklamia hominis]
MKRILVTGKNSYIGDNFTNWMNQWPDNYQVIQESLVGQAWKQSDWSNYDVVLHVAGLAHNSADPQLKDQYYRINRDLTIEAAKKAKEAGVKQFIFMSSIIVFGSKVSRITKETLPNPDNFYGDSKLKAEQGLKELIDEDFKIAIIRPPMVYGPGSKGNFPKLVKIAKFTPIFPDYNNKRSMIYIDNLMAVLKEVVDQDGWGYIHPQNKEYVKTSEMVKLIGQAANHKIYFVRWFNPVIQAMMGIGLINKVFGDLYYEEHIDHITDTISLEESIRRSI